jgi:hypothetical protein
LLAGLARLRIAVFHAEYEVAIVTHTPLMDMGQHISVIDFAGTWLFAAWIIPDLEIPNLGPAIIDVGYEVTFGNLLMINIEQYLARWAIHSAAHRKGLIRLLKKHAAMVGVPVQWL